VAGADDGELTPRGHAQPHPLRVAVLHNLKENAPHLNGQRPPDTLAELDSLRNVSDYVSALRALGHDVVAWEGDADLPRRLARQPRDICFNTCEGFRGAAREAQVPALLEMLGVPYTASDVLALAVTLDKAMTKRVLAHQRLPTPRFDEFRSAQQPLDPQLRFPLFVKPNAEGTGIGIHADAVVRTEIQLRERVDHVLRTYHQSALVEEYVEGRDVTCGLVGNVRPDGRTDDLHVFPVSEVNFAAYAPGTEPFYSYKLKVELAAAYRWICPAPIPDELTREIQRLTVETFRVCGCRDVARVDFRLDAHNGWQPMILEINALPGMNWNSDLTRCAETDGWTHFQLLQAAFHAAVDRRGLPRDRRGVREPNYECSMPNV
jgi:D-alanine-D-alanine ligase